MDGNVSISVQEGIRTKGSCRRWQDTAGGQRVCMEYGWHVKYRNLNKRASLRVMKRESYPRNLNSLRNDLGCRPRG